MPIDVNAVGAETEPVEVSWTSTDSLIYALGVGAGVDEPAFSTENTIDVAQQALPTMAVVLGRASAPGETALAEVYCAHARNRVAALCRGLDAPADDAHQRLGHAWLAGDLDHLLL